MATKQITQADCDEAWATIQEGEARLREIRQLQGRLGMEAQDINSRVYRARELIKQATR